MSGNSRLGITRAIKAGKGQRDVAEEAAELQEVEERPKRGRPAEKPAGKRGLAD